MSAKDGKPCKKCGGNEWSKRGDCAVCARNRASKWAKDNPDRHLEKGRKWRNENIEKSREYTRKYSEAHPEVGKEWRKNNPERINKSRQKWARNNPDKIKEGKHRWKAENKEKRREYDKEWAAKNPEKVKAKFLRWLNTHREEQRERARQWNIKNPQKAALYENKRRAKKVGNGGSHTVEEWEKLCAQHDFRCLACGRNDVKMTVDHVIPIDMGGSDNISNIQPLCKSCNSRKKNRHIDYR